LFLFAREKKITAVSTLYKAKEIAAAFNTDAVISEAKSI